MMVETTRINATITKSQDEFLDAQVRTGGFQSKSDVLRNLLREKMEEKKLAQMEYLKQRIADSEASGLSEQTPAQRQARIRTVIKQAATDKR